MTGGARTEGGRRAVALEGLTKTYQGVTAVADVSLSVAAGEILALLGPSGSGKTTTLRLLAGFERPDHGRVILEGRDVTHLDPVERGVGMVFQHYALFPHLDVGENVAFGLRSRGLRGRELDEEVALALSRVDLSGFERRSVSQLSGGQQQRVALARALAPAPRVLLLDEPLSNLDPSLRERTRRELRAMIHRIGITTVLVTHEQEEAFELGDRVAVLSEGRLEQVGTPDDLYGNPATRFVAGFVGRASMLQAVVAEHSGQGPALHLQVEGRSWVLDPDVVAAAASLSPGSPVILMVRPEGLELAPDGDEAIQGTVTERRFLGATALYTVATDGGHTVELTGAPGVAATGDRVAVRPTATGLHVFPRPA